MRISYQKGDFPFTIRDVVHLLRLNIRRTLGNGVYTDCPFCGDKRGKMFVNYEKDVFRCNYCDVGDGMLELYAKVFSIDAKTAYQHIMEALGTGTLAPGYSVPDAEPPPSIEQSLPANARQVHETLSLMFEMLSLNNHHLKNLHARGLDEKQIEQLGYKSTPGDTQRRKLTETLINLGCTVAGVPGFYIGKKGKWTVSFSKFTAGMLVPVKGMDGLIRGAQIRLDVPLEDGSKYIWFSSSSKYMGATSGSPAHFVGNPYATTVYVTEGPIKADVAHLFMNRTFVSVPGANNLRSLDEMFAALARNGTKLIVEAHDIDKYRNKSVKKGANRFYTMARSHGMDCRRLTWNPNYKGIDDWQLHLRRRVKLADKLNRMNFKERYLEGFCDAPSIENEIQRWNRMTQGRPILHEFLGLSADEYAKYRQSGDIGTVLQAQRKQQSYRVYQLELTEDNEVVPFAFADISVMWKEMACMQPPAAKYRLACDSWMYCPTTAGLFQMLSRIREKYADELPDGFGGRNVAPSDIIELYKDDVRRYFYVNKGNYVEVKFSPLLALPMNSSA